MKAHPRLNACVEDFWKYCCEISRCRNNTDILPLEWIAAFGHYDEEGIREAVEETEGMAIRRSLDDVECVVYLG